MRLTHYLWWFISNRHQTRISVHVQNIRRIFSATECILAVQGYPRLMILGTNRKRVCDFLLVRHGVG